MLRVYTIVLAVFCSQVACSAEPFALGDGDRVVFLGNSFFERAIPHGHIETSLTLRWPQHDITFRNLGWDGDTVYGHSRAGGRRRAVFGDAEEGFQRMVSHVKSLKPTVIFLAYGLNESFDGEAGLDKFRDGLKRLLTELGPSIRYVFVSPIRIEYPVAPIRSRVEDDVVTHVSDRNGMLERYCDMLDRVAAEGNHRYIDLFGEEESDNASVTNDGLHPHSHGYERLAELIASSLNAPKPGIDLATEEANSIRAAIVRKNTLYFHRWRPRNDAFVYGERKSEQVIAQGEPEQFEPHISGQEKEIRKLVAAIGGAK